MTSVTTPCAVCAGKSDDGRKAFFATRGLDWPVTEVAGHNVHRACAHEAEFAARRAADGTLAVGPDGIGRWTTNGSVIPDDSAALFAALGLAPGLDVAATAAARDAEVREVLARYRASQPAEPSPEQLTEMRAAFGAGATVVDVITGRVTRL